MACVTEGVCVTARSGCGLPNALLAALERDALSARRPTVTMVTIVNAVTMVTTPPAGRQRNQKILDHCTHSHGVIDPRSFTVGPDRVLPGLAGQPRLPGPAAQPMRSRPARRPVPVAQSTTLEQVVPIAQQLALPRRRAAC